MFGSGEGEIYPLNIEGVMDDLKRGESRYILVTIWSRRRLEIENVIV